ncbi:MAG: hypothetical protein R3F48_02205 [Candidatus Zixiibacteriota bacterium]
MSTSQQKHRFGLTWGEWFILAVLGVIFAVQLFIAWNFTADDAFISFRYAQHFADGNGLVWNVGDANHVEGFTNFLWTMLMVVPHYLHLNVVFFSKCLGLLFFLLCAGILYFYTRGKTGNSLIALLSLSFFLILPSSYFHAVSGMETMFFAFLLLLIFISGYEALTCESSLRAGYFYSTPLLVLAAGMTRPEGLLPGLFVLALIYFTIDEQSRRRFLIATSLLLVLPGLIYFVARYSYYGWFFPNSFYVKFGGLVNGLEWILGAAGSLVGCLIIILLASPRKNQIRQRRIGTKLYFLLFLFFSVIVYPISDLMMNFMGRFLYHLIPVIIFTVAFSLDNLREIFLRGLYADHRRATVVTVLLGLLCILPLVHSDKREVAHMALYTPHLKYSHIALAKVLADSDVPSDKRTLAVGDAGAIPYYSRWTAYDLVGLNDETIAHHREHATDYIRRANPTVLILYSYDGVTPRSDHYGLIADSILADFQQAAFIKMFPNYFIGVFVNRSLASDVQDRLIAQIREVAAVADRKNRAVDNRMGLLEYLAGRLGR